MHSHSYSHTRTRVFIHAIWKTTCYAYVQINLADTFVSLCVVKRFFQPSPNLYFTQSANYAVNCLFTPCAVVNQVHAVPITNTISFDHVPMYLVSFVCFIWYLVSVAYVYLSEINSTRLQV